MPATHDAPHARPTHNDLAPDAPSFAQALRFWLKLGFVSFGGPAGQIALMHQELVDRRRWISEHRFLHALNYCMLLPGPEAQQLATYIGWLLHRTRGGVSAGVLFVLPSLLLLIALSWLYVALGTHPWVSAAFYGIKPAVTAIVLAAAVRIGARTLHHPLLVAVAAAAFVAVALLHVPFPAVVAAAAACGWLGRHLVPAAFARRTAPTQADGRPHPRAVIDDDTPAPPHARGGWGRAARVGAVALLLWALPMLGLGLGLGWAHGYSQMGWFFTKAALLTFGGAYAVLPYVYQGAVAHHGWLSAPQMIDGLALGETTPGPLIMVVAFVGFLGGYQQQMLGPESLLWAGALAACVVTWFTFLPSFALILAGAPLVERTRGALTFTAPLTGITAAVVGVVLNLALFFALHVLWPQGMQGRFDGVAALLTLLAALALMRWRMGVVRVLAGTALLGGGAQLLGLAA